MEEWVLSDDRIVEGDRVSLSVRGAGFAYGFGVFETMKFLDGKPCFFNEHMERLVRSLGAVRLQFPIEKATLRQKCIELLDANGVSDGIFKIVVWDDGVSSRLVGFVRDRELPKPKTSVQILESSACVSSRALSRRVKSLNYMQTVLDLREAREQGFDECFYLNEKKEVTETSISNLFFRKGNRVCTASIDCGVLEGVIRKKALDAVESMGLVISVGSWSLDALRGADEVFVTNSGVAACSVSRICFQDGGEMEYSEGIAPRVRDWILHLERSSLD